MIICSDAGRLRSLGDELIILRVGVEVQLTTDRGGETGLFLKRLQIIFLLINQLKSSYLLNPTCSTFIIL